MNKATGSIGVVFMVLTIALATTGAAYALWFKDLIITANVETDTVDVRYSNLPNPTSGEGPFTNDDGVINNAEKDDGDDDIGEVYDAHQCGPLPDTCSSGDPSGPGNILDVDPRVDPLKDVGICTVEKKSDEMVLAVSIKYVAWPAGADPDMQGGGWKQQ